MSQSAESIATTTFIRDARQVVTAIGPQAQSFLQGQLSQDIDKLAPGDTVRSLLLQPQGKLVAWLRVSRLGDESWALECDAGFAEAVVARLERFKLRTKCDLAIADWQAVRLIGPGATSVISDRHSLDIVDSWAGTAVRDLFDTSADLSPFDEATAEAVTALRIESGVPAMGSELDESTIPAAAGIVDQAVSFTKGCYTGQELVARIDSRGNNVPRRLLGLVADSPLAAGADVLAADGALAGRITSAGHSARLGRSVALAYIGRGTDVGAQLLADTEAGAIKVEVRALPLV